MIYIVNLDPEIFCKTAIPESSFLDFLRKFTKRKGKQVRFLIDDKNSYKEKIQECIKKTRNPINVKAAGEFLKMLLNKKNIVKLKVKDDRNNLKDLLNHKYLDGYISTKNKPLEREEGVKNYDVESKDLDDEIDNEVRTLIENNLILSDTHIPLSYFEDNMSRKLQ